MLEKIYLSHTGEKIDLSTLSFEELQQLSFNEETFFARRIEETPPFSKERNEFSNQAYQKIFLISDWMKKTTGQIGNGIRDRYAVNLLKRIIKKERAKKSTVLFYEAGVGKGIALSQLADENIMIRGCDVFLSDEAKELQRNHSNVDLIEENLYDALDNIEDSSVDIFYADNVLEHVVSDEYDETCKKIGSKLKKGGVAVFFIPNAYVGPSDISKIALPFGSKATGFHFMEQSFNKNVEIFGKYGMKPEYFCWLSPFSKKIYYMKDVLSFNTIKKKIEKYLGKIKSERVRKFVFRTMTYHVYVLRKQN